MNSVPAREQPAPSPLPENTGLAFLGEMAWPAATLTARQAEQFAAAANACGRPNSDVLRRRLAAVGGEPTESWQIDFPDHFTAQEAALYEQPFARLRQHAPRLADPHANPALRRALARVSRYLATRPAPPLPSGSGSRTTSSRTPACSSWPAMTTSRTACSNPRLRLWWHEWRAAFSPDAIVASFPFPWPPATPLSALTATQEEQRHALARAARSDDTESLNAAVLAAYGWPANLGDDELLENLAGLNLKRTD